MRPHMRQTSISVSEEEASLSSGMVASSWNGGFLGGGGEADDVRTGADGRWQCGECAC
jgi:hypothetical protein